MPRIFRDKGIDLHLEEIRSGLLVNKSEPANMIEGNLEKLKEVFLLGAVRVEELGF